MTVVDVAASLLKASWWPLFALPLIMVAVDHLARQDLRAAVLVIAREETYLRRRFNAAYEDFYGRVRRWL